MARDRTKVAERKETERNRRLDEAVEAICHDLMVAAALAGQPDVALVAQAIGTAFMYEPQGDDTLTLVKALRTNATRYLAKRGEAFFVPVSDRHAPVVSRTTTEKARLVEYLANACDFWAPGASTVKSLKPALKFEVIPQDELDAAGRDAVMIIAGGVRSNHPERVYLQKRIRNESVEWRALRLARTAVTRVHAFITWLHPRASLRTQADTLGYLYPLVRRALSLDFAPSARSREVVVGHVSVARA